MTKEDVLKIIQEYMSQQAVGSFKVPYHLHNGSDSPQIPIENIPLLPNRGIPFTNGTQVRYAMYETDFSSSGGSGLVIEPSGAFGVVGGQLSLGGGFAYDGKFSAITMVTANPTDTAEVNVAITPSTLRPGMSFTVLGNFALSLPDTTRPAPIAGMIAFEAGTFYGCQVTGVWKTFTLV